MEVCPEAAVIIQKLASQLKKYGGAALIADYGHSGDKEDTFRVCVYYVQVIIFGQ